MTTMTSKILDVFNLALNWNYSHNIIICENLGISNVKREEKMNYTWNSLIAAGVYVVLHALYN